MSTISTINIHRKMNFNRVLMLAILNFRLIITIK